jgi:hypothetical protein
MNTATITATRHNGFFVASAWECWYGASDRACQVTAWAWGLYREAFFSPAALARYRWAGQMIACLGLLAYLAGKLTRLWLQPRVDAWVDSCQASEPVQEAPEPTPAPVASPVPQPQPEATPLAALGIRELRKLGTAQGIRGAARMKKSAWRPRLPLPPHSAARGPTTYPRSLNK